MKITETNEGVEINGMTISGFVDTVKKCGTCFNYKIYYDDYDAFFCAQCNKWLEKACGDSECDYCSKRPDKPLNH